MRLISSLPRRQHASETYDELLSSLPPDYFEQVVGSLW